MDTWEADRLRALRSCAILDTPPEPNFDRITVLTAAIFDLPVCTLSLADTDRHWFKSHSGIASSEMPRKMSFCDVTIRGDHAFVVPDARADARFREAPVVVGAPYFRFYAGAPLITPDGAHIGSLCVLDTKPHRKFGAREAAILEDMAGTAVELIEARLRHIELAKSREEIAHLARHDPLTGLANRRLLREHLDDATARCGAEDLMAVLYLDLDDFKAINDTYGHLVGDTLLQQVAARLRRNVRDGDKIARLGGDEFVVVLVDPQAREHATDLADRLIRMMSAPYDVLGNRLSVGMSVGVAVGAGDPAASGEPDQVFQQADVALYQAKAAGGGTYRFFEPGMDAGEMPHSSVAFAAMSRLGGPK